MTFPKNPTDLILAADYNYLQAQVEEIIGQNENGYGFSEIYSLPVSDANKVDTNSWRYLIRDLNIVSAHITNVTTATDISGITTGSLITTSMPNSAATNAAYALANRYTCHPAQYFTDPVTGGTVNYEGGTSTRTTVWGVDLREIHHTARVSFPTRLMARYFFNLGSYIQWTNRDLNNGLNDIDAEWATFFDSVLETPYIYSRNQYVNYDSTTTTYNSGTLQIEITANIVGSVGDPEYGRAIDFSIYYRNNDSSNLIVSPTVAYWNILI